MTGGRATPSCAHAKQAFRLPDLTWSRLPEPGWSWIPELSGPAWPNRGWSCYPGPLHPVKGAMVRRRVRTRVLGRRAKWSFRTSSTRAQRSGAVNPVWKEAAPSGDDCTLLASATVCSRLLPSAPVVLMWHVAALRPLRSCRAIAAIPLRFASASDVPTHQPRPPGPLPK